MRRGEFNEHRYGKEVDAMFIFSGAGDQSAIGNEHQNLIDAYEDAPVHLKRGALAVLTPLRETCRASSLRGNARLQCGFGRADE